MMLFDGTTEIHCVGCGKKFLHKNEFIQHLEVCPEHPLAGLHDLAQRKSAECTALKQENDALRKQIEELTKGEKK